jgi:hypothetical protein
LPSGRKKSTTPLLARLGKALREPVRQLDGHGHQLFGLVAGEAEHQALVAGAARYPRPWRCPAIGASWIEERRRRFGVEAVLRRV